MQKAVSRSAKNPDFDGLEVYLSHMADPGMALAATGFDEHVANTLKVQSAVQNQQRLAQEAKIAADKKKKAAKGEGKGDQ